MNGFRSIYHMRWDLGTWTKIKHSYLNRFLIGCSKIMTDPLEIWAQIGLFTFLHPPSPVTLLLLRKIRMGNRKIFKLPSRENCQKSLWYIVKFAKRNCLGNMGKLSNISQISLQISFKGKLSHLWSKDFQNLLK